MIIPAYVDTTLRLLFGRYEAPPPTLLADDTGATLIFVHFDAQQTVAFGHKLARLRADLNDEPLSPLFAAQTLVIGKGVATVLLLPKATRATTTSPHKRLTYRPDLSHRSKRQKHKGALTGDTLMATLAQVEDFFQHPHITQHLQHVDGEKVEDLQVLNNDDGTVTLRVQTYYANHRKYQTYYVDVLADGTLDPDIAIDVDDTDCAGCEADYGEPNHTGR